MLDRPAGCGTNCGEALLLTSYALLETLRAYLFAAQKGVEDEPRIRHLVARERVRLLHAARVGHTCPTEVRQVRIVVSSVGGAVRVLGTDRGARGVREVEVH